MLESVLFFPVPHRTQRGRGLPRRSAPRNDRVFDCVPFISPLSFRGGRQPEVGIRSLFPGPTSHTRGCGLPRRFAPRNDRVLTAHRSSLLCHSEEGVSPRWESVLFFSAFRIAHKGDADCRVASLLAMTDSELRSVLLSPVIPRRGAAPTWESASPPQYKKPPQVPLGTCGGEADGGQAPSFSNLLW